MKKISIACVFLVLCFFAASQLAAVEWARDWNDGSQSSQLEQQAEFLLLKNLQLAPHGEVQRVPVAIRFGSGSQLPSMLIGERERIFTFVFISTADHAGVTYCVTTRVMCIPPKASQPFVWEPRGFTKKNSFIAEEDPRVELRRLGLLPAGDFDFWFKKEQQPISWPALAEQLAAGLTFDFRLDLKATRPAGYEIPSTIDAQTLAIRVLTDGVAQVSFRDVARVALAQGAVQQDEQSVARGRERVLYQFIVEKRYGFDSAHVYRPIGESAVPAVAGANQVISIEQHASYLTQALEANKFYRIKIKVARPSYGAVPSEELIKAFAYIRGEVF